MPKLSVDLDVLRHAVLDHSLSEVGDSLLRTAVKAPAKLGSLSLAPAAEMSIQVFNRPEDKDQDAVFGEKAHIAFDLQRAWVKYKLSARAEAKLPFLAAGMNASRDVQMSDYRVHLP